MTSATDRVTGGANTKIGSIELPPLRPVDDFILDGARFSVPPFKDLEKWNNRILHNLVYYQTNYFLMILVIFAIVGMLHPNEVLTGFMCIGAVVGVAFGVFSANSDALQFKRDHPVVTLCAMVVVMYLLVSTMSSIVVFLYGLCLPLLVMFVHASCRLRSVRNKIVAQLDKFSVKRTAMGNILEALNVEVDTIPTLRLD